MAPEDFVKSYEAALGRQDWESVAPLIADTARVVFSDGRVLSGKAAIRAAYEHNFATIKGEEFRVENVEWLVRTDKAAAYGFDFRWSGYIDGQLASGSGRGTAVLARQDEVWVLVGEQLGPKS